MLRLVDFILGTLPMPKIALKIIFDDYSSPDLIS